MRIVRKKFTNNKKFLYRQLYVSVYDVCVFINVVQRTTCMIWHQNYELKLSKQHLAHSYFVLNLNQFPVFDLTASKQRNTWNMYIECRDVNAESHHTHISMEMKCKHQTLNTHSNSDDNNTNINNNNKHGNSIINNSQKNYLTLQTNHQPYGFLSVTAS